MTTDIAAPAYIKDWPGKSDGFHPAAYHMLDVAAVAEILIEPEGMSRPRAQALVLLAALHDLGKINQRFRAMLMDGTAQGIRKFQGNGELIGIVQAKYLNNIVEQDHRFIKRITRPMMGFKAFQSAAATLAGIKTAHMIRKGQIGPQGPNGFQQFATLAG